MSAKQKRASLDDFARNEVSEYVAEHHGLDIAHTLRVPITIDRTGWLRSEIDFLYERHATGFRPVHVNIGRQARLEDVNAIGDVYLHFDRYNLAISRLHGLKLKQIDRDIDKRQRDYMGHGTVRFRTLLREIAYLDAFFDSYASASELSPVATHGPRTREPSRCP